MGWRALVFEIKQNLLLFKCLLILINPISLSLCRFLLWPPKYCYIIFPTALWGWKKLHFLYLMSVTMHKLKAITLMLRLWRYYFLIIFRRLLLSTSLIDYFILFNLGQIFYNSDSEKLPRIFGMTASPKLGKGDVIFLLQLFNDVSYLLEISVGLYL